jgi:hypothetical protein
MSRKKVTLRLSSDVVERAKDVVVKDMGRKVKIFRNEIN